MALVNLNIAGVVTTAGNIRRGFGINVMVAGIDMITIPMGNYLDTDDGKFTCSETDTIVIDVYANNDNGLTFNIGNYGGSSLALTAISNTHWQITTTGSALSAVKRNTSSNYDNVYLFYNESGNYQIGKVYISDTGDSNYSITNDIIELPAVSNVILTADTGYKFDSNNLPIMESVSNPSWSVIGSLSNNDTVATFSISYSQFSNNIGNNLGDDTTANVNLDATIIVDSSTVTFTIDDGDPSNCTYSPSPITYNDSATSVTLVFTASNGYQFDSNNIPVIYDAVDSGVAYTAVLSSNDSVATFTFDVDDLKNCCTYDSLLDVYIISMSCSLIVIPTPSPLMGVWVVDNTILDVINNAIFVISGGSNADVINNVYSLKQFYCIVPTGGSANLKIGSYDFQTNCPFVEEPYNGSIYCGSITVPKLTNDYLSYNPYKRFRLFLPFIGFIDIDDKVVGKDLKLYYKVDYVSGKCLAMVYYEEAGNDVLLLNEEGIITIDFPIRVSYSERFTFSRDTMVLSELTPYLEITSQPAIGGDGSSINGYISDELKTVNQCSGYTRFKSVNVANVKCSETEINLIKQALLDGIIV